MKFNNKYSIYSIFFAALALTGCKKLVEVDPPVTQPVSASVYTTDATATAALSGIYNRMISENDGYSSGSYSISALAGLSADEFRNYSSTTELWSQCYTNDLQNTSNLSLWTKLYRDIYVSNAVVEGLAASTGLTPSVKQQLQGEAKFLRAFFYFYLTNLYGDVPLITSTDYRANTEASRNASSEVYRQIITDLTEAQSLLNENYMGLDVTSPTTERVRPNKSAATALLARVYLYNGRWAEAEEQATAVVNNSSAYSLLTDLNTVYLKNSKEAIWQLQPVAPQYNTWDGAAFNLSLFGATYGIPPPVNDVNPFSLSDLLFNTFEPGDKRKTNWTGSFTLNGITYNYPTKYKVITSATVTEYLMVLRLAEQYLIRAEARAQQDNVSGAQADLDVIRTRAGLAGTTADNKASLLTAILHERQVEFFTEWGHRWFDLKRTGNIDAAMATVAPSKGGTWSAYKALFPIKQTELDRAPNLSQTPGY